MGYSKRIVTPVGQSLVVAAALGKSLGTLLGPTDARKIVFQRTFQDGGYETISSDPVALLRAMDVVHPVGALVLEALEGMEVTFGTGASSLVTLCGALSTAFRELKEQGLPSNATVRGLQMAEDICMNVLRGLSLPIDKLAEDLQSTLGHQRYQRIHDANFAPSRVEGGFQTGSGAHSQQTISVPVLAALAAGLQHDANCCNTVATEVWQESSSASRTRRTEPSTMHPELSVPAALAVQAIAAVLVPYEQTEGSRIADVVPDLARVRTRLVVGPTSATSFVAPGAAVVEVPPWQRTAVADAFIKRRCACGPQTVETCGSPPLATATMRVKGVVVVVGDVRAGAGASSAANTQTPVTSVFRRGKTLLMRSNASSNMEDRWVEEASQIIGRLRVEILVVTGEVCPQLQQVLASRGTLVLSGTSQDEAEMAALASGATQVPRLDVLTVGDVGRGSKAKHRGEEYKDATIYDSHGCTRFSAGERRASEDGSQEGVCPSSCDCCGRQRRDLHGPDLARCQRPRFGMAASLLEVGTTSDDQNKFTPTPAARVGPGLSAPGMVILLHQPEETAGGFNDNEGRWARQPATRNDCQAGDNATVVVVLCGPIPSACEELRHRFWRVVRRVAGALSERLVLPGAGACEVVCASTLEVEAARLEKENAGNIAHSVPTELYMPAVLRSMAAALDDLVLTCLENAGHRASSALHRLAEAKKTATSRLTSRRRQPRPGSPGASGSNPPGLDLSCLTWGFCSDLAVVALPDPNNDEKLATESWGDMPESLGGSGGSWVCHGKGRTFVFDNFGAKLGCFERAVGLVGLLAGTDGMLLAPLPP